MRLLKPHRRMLPLGCQLLVAAMFALVGATGLMEGRPLPGVQQGLGAVVILERQERLDLLCQGRLGGGSVLEVPLGGFASGDKGGHLLGVAVAAVLCVRGLAVLGECDTLFALPAP
jgi:hypothetical protein